MRDSGGGVNKITTAPQASIEAITGIGHLCVSLVTAWIASLRLRQVDARCTRHMVSGKLATVHPWLLIQACLGSTGLTGM